MHGGDQDADERRGHELAQLDERLESVNGNRRRRIARGSGTTVQEVNQLLKQYTEVRKMMKSLTSGGAMKRKLAALMR